MFQLSLLGLAAVLIQNAAAGSAVVHDGHGHTVYSAGYPEIKAKQLALEVSWRRGWKDAKIIAASDVTGRCHKTGKHHGSILLTFFYQVGGINCVNQGIGPGPDQCRPELRQRRRWCRRRGFLRLR